ncbi:DUF3299 domain-containing protein [Pseudoruegeria sp. SHC-113]|uniref:DUF3299 domain-containing protein n=1 Tax=Pseudoruegeria sp. SHC-113 TaxID=2855439 RepID=UPI0021BB572A|nr:DUF3299 domain-containing protein [Pseudoruegeria sp. SHC-113]MCT8160662.1 DUF3299 domain-containing protein [Pseudoruegeria sp. SHC-113]
MFTIGAQQHNSRALLSVSRLLPFVAALALPFEVHAEAGTLTDWQDLAPAVEAFEDPFLGLTYRQKDDLRIVLKASVESGDADQAQSASEARARLQSVGLDADTLLQQRLVVMEKRRARDTGVTEEFLGQDVVVDGYVLPLASRDGRVTSFLLVPWVGACIHTPAPPPNQMIRVDVAEGIKASETFHAIRLQGVLQHKPSVSNLFLVDGQSLVEASYALESAEVWTETN